MEREETNQLEDRKEEDIKEEDRKEAKDREYKEVHKRKGDGWPDRMVKSNTEEKSHKRLRQFNMQSSMLESVFSQQAEDGSPELRRIYAQILSKILAEIKSKKLVAEQSDNITTIKQICEFTSIQIEELKKAFSQQENKASQGDLYLITNGIIQIAGAIGGIPVIIDNSFSDLAQSVRIKRRTLPNIDIYDVLNSLSKLVSDLRDNVAQRYISSFMLVPSVFAQQQADERASQRAALKGLAGVTLERKA